MGALAELTFLRDCVNGGPRTVLGHQIKKGNSTATKQTCRSSRLALLGTLQTVKSYALNN